VRNPARCVFFLEERPHFRVAHSNCSQIENGLHQAFLGMNPTKPFPPVFRRSGFCFLERMPAVRAFYILVGHLPGTFRTLNNCHAYQIAHVFPKIATANERDREWVRPRISRSGSSTVPVS
jgi:hypothetical protein